MTDDLAPVVVPKDQVPSAVVAKIARKLESQRLRGVSRSWGYLAWGLAMFLPAVDWGRFWLVAVLGTICIGGPIGVWLQYRSLVAAARRVAHAAESRPELEWHFDHNALGAKGELTLVLEVPPEVVVEELRAPPSCALPAARALED